MQKLRAQVQCLLEKLAEAGAAHQRVRKESAREMATARAAWEVRRRSELQVWHLPF